MSMSHHSATRAYRWFTWGSFFASGVEEFGD